MNGRKRIGCWIAVGVAYYLCALAVMIKSFPVTVDGMGVTATLYWGDHYPMATLQEFDQDFGESSHTSMLANDKVNCRGRLQER